MKGFGLWLQLSIFQCILSPVKLKRMEYALHEIIKDGEDHVLIIDLGPAEHVKPRFTSLGKPFEILERKPIIV
jgi:CRISPR-associated protein Cas2